MCDTRAGVPVQPEPAVQVLGAGIGNCTGRRHRRRGPASRPPHGEQEIMLGPARGRFATHAPRSCRASAGTTSSQRRFPPALRWRASGPETLSISVRESCVPGQCSPNLLRHLRLVLGTEQAGECSARNRGHLKRCMSTAHHERQGRRYRHTQLHDISLARFTLSSGIRGLSIGLHACVALMHVLTHARAL